jgi:hypothetical protein
MRACHICGRPKHKGLCDMARLSDGRLVHVSRIDPYDGDVRKEIESGTVRVVNRWIKKKEKRLA